MLASTFDKDNTSVPIKFKAFIVDVCHKLSVTSGISV